MDVKTVHKGCHELPCMKMPRSIRAGYLHYWLPPKNFLYRR